MLTSPMDVLASYPVRKTAKQKEEFREDVCAYAARLGYPVTVEAGRFGCRNVVMGNPESPRFLVTAHYDTPVKLPFPNLITPCNGWLFLGRQILMYLTIALTSALTGTVCGLVFGKWAVLYGSVFAVALILGRLRFGPANPSNANDNTSGVVTLLEIMRTLPEIQRKKVCFVLFDLEEAGMVGSKAYRKAHRQATESQIVLNLDCVGEGDHLRIFPTGALKKDRRKLTSLYKACGYFGSKDILVAEKGFTVYPSDQRSFPCGVGICALKKGKFGLYLGKIHTPKDTVLEITNINLLRSALTTYLTCGPEL